MTFEQAQQLLADTTQIIAYQHFQYEYSAFLVGVVVASIFAITWRK